MGKHHLRRVVIEDFIRGLLSRISQYSVSKISVLPTQHPSTKTFTLCPEGPRGLLNILHRTQAGRRLQVSIRHKAREQVHQTPTLPHGITLINFRITTAEGVSHLARPNRGVSSHPNLFRLSQISQVLHLGTTYPIQGATLWSVHRAKDLYETSCQSNLTPQTIGGSCTPISGRPVDKGKLMHTIIAQH